MKSTKRGDGLEPLTAQEALEFIKSKLLPACEQIPNSGIYYRNIVLSLGYLFPKESDHFIKWLTPGEPEKPKEVVNEVSELKTFDNLGKDDGLIIEGTTVYSNGGADCESCPG